MDGKRKWARRAVLALFLPSVAAAALFFALPKLMIAPLIAPQSDVILHISVDTHSKADEYIAGLYQRGIARKIVCLSSQVSWDVFPGDYARKHLISLGVPAEDVFSLRLPVTPCGGVNRPTLVNAMKSHGWKSALFLTHPEDSRYAEHLIRNYFERDGVTVAVSYAPEDKEALTKDWWRTHWKVQRFIGEILNATLDQFYAECR